MAPKTILTLNREPIWPVRRSAQRRTTLRVKISRKTRNIAKIKTERAKRMTALPWSAGAGTLKDPRVIAAAASKTTTIDPTVSQTLRLLRASFTLPAFLEISSQRTLIAERLLDAAKLFSVGDNQGMKFVKPARIA